jgi:hypothetical protein
MKSLIVFSFLLSTFAHAQVENFSEASIADEINNHISRESEGLPTERLTIEMARGISEEECNGLGKTTKTALAFSVKSLNLNETGAVFSRYQRSEKYPLQPPSEPICFLDLVFQSDVVGMSHKSISTKIVKKKDFEVIKAEASKLMEELQKDTSVFLTKPVVKVKGIGNKRQILIEYVNLSRIE